MTAPCGALPKRDAAEIIRSLATRDACRYRRMNFLRAYQ